MSPFWSRKSVELLMKKIEGEVAGQEVQIAYRAFATRDSLVDSKVNLKSYVNSQQLLY